MSVSHLSYPLSMPALADLRIEFSLLVTDRSGVMTRLLWAHGTSLHALIECLADGDGLNTHYSIHPA